jgi:DNA primase
MAGHIPRSFIEDLVHRADIVSVVGRRVALKKAGNSYKACCPFHHEKSPSFHVNPAKQFYHCFGCGVHGNALNFIIEYDQLDFVSAVETLANEMGVNVVYESREQTPEQRQVEQETRQTAKQKKATALEMLTQSAQWFMQNLRTHPQAKEAVSYLQGRGLSGEIARDFLIGFAPSVKTGLQTAFPEVELETWQEIGLVVEREGQWIDKFRARVIFPIRDLRGQVIAFGGRIIHASEHAPKYLNSPETPYFHKSQTLYGLYELIKRVRNPQSIIVVEGYMDVVALAQMGVYHAVATLGTATTEQHLTLLFRYSALVVFAFDGDRAGRDAAKKALAVALPLLGGDRAIRFFFLPDGEDPDTFVRSVGAEVFQQKVTERALSQGQWLVQYLASTHHLDWKIADDARRLIALSAEWVKLCPDVSVRYSLIQAMAQVADMQEWQVERALGIKTGMAVHRKPERSASTSGTTYSLRYQRRFERPTDAPLSAQPSLAQNLLRLLACYPVLASQWPEKDAPFIRLLPNEAVQTLLVALEHAESMQEVVAQGWMDQASAEQEWRDGWRQLLCQALQYVRDESLKRVTDPSTQEALIAQVRLISQRWRRDCHKLGK